MNLLVNGLPLSPEESDKEKKNVRSDGEPQVTRLTRSLSSCSQLHAVDAYQQIICYPGKKRKNEGGKKRKKEKEFRRTP